MSVKSSKARADRKFSEYIRRRDSGHSGYGRCISCGKMIHWKEADAGHYVNRKHMSLRYDEKNVNLQCRACNRFDEGNMLGYHKGLVEKYGSGVIDYLDMKRHNTCRMTEFEFKLIGDQYHRKIKELE